MSVADTKVMMKMIWNNSLKYEICDRRRMTILIWRSSDMCNELTSDGQCIENHPIINEDHGNCIQWYNMREMRRYNEENEMQWQRKYDRSDNGNDEEMWRKIWKMTLKANMEDRK